MSETSTREAYSVEEAAELCGVSTKTVYEACQRDEFPHVRLGRKILVPRRRFLVWLNGDLALRDLEDVQSPQPSP